MTENATTKVAVISDRLLGDAYLAWFSAESECERALGAWFQDADAGRGGAYFAYRMALDREEAAARHLERVLRFAERSETRFAHGADSVVE
jgi:hypothetical protein